MNIKTQSITSFALTFALLIVAASASAEDVFIHFEDMEVGDDVAGLGTVHQNLSIEPLNDYGQLSVIETFYTGDVREYTVFKAPNRNSWDPWHTNNGLEDRYGDIVDSQRPDFVEGMTAKGFANTDCSWLGFSDEYWCPQEYAITFGDRRVYKFKMLMVDYGDFNPNHELEHQVYLRGFQNGAEVGVSYTLEYTTENHLVPRWASLGFDPKVEADASDSQQSGMGHIHMEVHAPPGSNGFDRIELSMGEGFDPNAAFDSLSIGYVNLFDLHPTSCPNPFNLGSPNGSLPAAVLGTEEFDVSDVVPGSCKLEGVSPTHWAQEDVSRPYVGDLVDRDSCTTEGPDGYTDLTLHYDKSEIAAALGDLPDRTTLEVEIVCDLADGGELRSEDVMWIRN